MDAEKDYKRRSYHTPFDEVLEKEKKPHLDFYKRLENEVRTKATEKARKKFGHEDIKEEEKVNELIEEEVKNYKERLGLDKYRIQIYEMDKNVVSVIERDVIPLYRDKERIEDLWTELKKDDEDKKKRGIKK